MSGFTNYVSSFFSKSNATELKSEPEKSVPESEVTVIPSVWPVSESVEGDKTTKPKMWHKNLSSYVSKPVEEAPQGKFSYKTVERPTETPQGKFSDYLSTYYGHSNNNSKTRKDKRNIFHSTDVKLETSKDAIVHQVVFLMDATGSMSSYIEGTKEEIHKFVNKMKEESLKTAEGFPLRFEVGVIAYRDFSDREHFETLNFTDNIDLVAEFLTNVHASGGGDSPEDVKGSFVHALFGVDDVSKRLSWDESEDCASKTLIWLADAPAHGYANSLGDDYPDNNQNEWSFLFDEMKRMDVDMYIAKIKEDTKKTNDAFTKFAEERTIKLETVDISQSVGKRDAHTGEVRAFASDEAYACMSERVIAPQAAKNYSMAMKKKSMFSSSS
ncbi:MAG: hypothetical protein Terrestrivirus2_183 [Terrestrivirus sp.]|uniref:VWFA domain-containing protein n=1 Tax=Terrestrivirus sp. TaxID=2487775 RepID=A0A3G4ZLF5_9VIRU|nr:MAG: hypothetical protein Terrestrivirus2_183 [Terrestrivirus sp.]